MPKMFPVDSSAIARIGYDVEAEEVYIEFRESGGLYAYSGVPLEVFAELARADSKGSFVNAVIKRYPVRKLSGRT